MHGRGDVRLRPMLPCLEATQLMEMEMDEATPDPATLPQPLTVQPQQTRREVEMLEHPERPQVGLTVE